MHGALVARPFDERRLQVSGEAVTLGEADGRAPVSVSLTGVLAFQSNLGRTVSHLTWVAYSSDESGKREVYVRDFAPDRVPATGSFKIQISRAGGDKPRWSRNGQELYDIAADRKLTAVAIVSGSTFKAGVPMPLFETDTAGYLPYDVAPDGRFLINTVSDRSTGDVQPLTVFLNWREALKR